MPDQDERISDPDSDNITNDERGTAVRASTSDRPIGSIERGSLRKGGAAPRLDLAVDNGGYRTDLKEIVRDAHARRRSCPGPSGGAGRSAAGLVIEAQEETARRIAQRLHDEASQMLAIVYLELDNIARNSPEQTARRIDRVIKHLDSVSEQIRSLSHELHPMVLERNGLLPALQQLAHGVRKRSGLRVEVSGQARDLAPAVEAAIYRAVQEAVTNVIRHASASQVHITLRQTQDRLYCSVRDDGVGYSPSGRGSDEGAGLGFVGIVERIDALGGECHILSGARKGMELRMGIPL